MSSIVRGVFSGRIAKAIDVPSTVAPANEILGFAAAQYLHRVIAILLTVLAALGLVLHLIGTAHARTPIKIACPNDPLTIYQETIIIDPTNKTCDHSNSSIDYASGDKLYLGLSNNPDPDGLLVPISSHNQTAPRYSYSASEGPDTFNLTNLEKHFFWSGEDRHISVQIHELATKKPVAEFTARFAIVGDNERAEISIPDGVTFYGVEEPAEVAQIADTTAPVFTALPTDLTAGVAPMVEILDAPETISDLTPFAIRVVFSEEITGFELADITVANGSASDLVTSDNISFTADITPDGSGDITLDILAGAAQDLSGNDNIAAEQVVIENQIDEITKQVIANFMLNRANFLLGNQPDISGLLRGTHGNGGGTLGALAFTGNESGMDLAFATSLSKIDRERQRAIEQRVAEAHRFAGSAHDAMPLSVDGADIIPSGAEGGAIIAPTQSNSDLYGTIPDRRYDIWTEVYGATSTAGDNESTYWVGYLGGHYFVSEDLIIGGLVQLDWSDEEDSVAGSTADGFGWMVGPYMAGTVPDTTLTWDVRAAWGRSNNTVNPIGIYTDDFETERWLVSGKVQGSFDISELTVTPSLQASYFEETQQAYTDSLGNDITEQTISLGEIKFGPEFSMNQIMENGLVVSPSMAISGVWNFGLRDNETSQGYVLGDEEIRARIDFGIDLRDPQGRSLALSGYYDGLGVEDYEAMGGEIRLSIPFQ